jgi:N-acetyl-anhydromuramyl-L-alanine amidase AmpD
MRCVDNIILHCSASDYPNQNAAWIDKIHREERGFTSIGYHYFIDFNGTIEIGRPIEEPGSHAVGYNLHSIGICLAGLKNFNEFQFKSLRTLLNLLTHIPECQSARVIPHNAVNADKTCPNFDVRPFQLK